MHIIERQSIQRVNVTLASKELKISSQQMTAGFRVEFIYRSVSEGLHFLMNSIN